jgi:hypothetical protein
MWEKTASQGKPSVEAEKEWQGRPISSGREKSFVEMDGK